MNRRRISILTRDHHERLPPPASSPATPADASSRTEEANGCMIPRKTPELLRSSGGSAVRRPIRNTAMWLFVYVWLLVDALVACLRRVKVLW
jgi:hypothetical protein